MQPQLVSALPFGHAYTNIVKVLVIPSSMAICERDFFKQNLIKSHLKASLKLEKLHALMGISLADNPFNWVGERWPSCVLCLINKT